LTHVQHWAVFVNYVIQLGDLFWSLKNIFCYFLLKDWALDENVVYVTQSVARASNLLEAAVAAGLLYFKSLTLFPETRNGREPRTNEMGLLTCPKH
jgi:hypothetical protein